MDEDTCIIEEKVNGSPSSVPNNKEMSIEGMTPSPKERTTPTLIEEIKDSDNNSENDSRSSSSTGKNVARRGRKRKHAEFGEPPQRATPRRAARNVKCYVDDDVFNEIDEMRSSDPDYNLSDSDDDPDFDPSLKGTTHSPEFDHRAKRGKGYRGKGRGASRVSGLTTTPTRGSSLRQSVESADEDSNSGTRAPSPNHPTDTNHDDPANGANAQRRRGRPPVYQTTAPESSPQTQLQQEQSSPQQISDNTVSSTDDATKASSGKLSSAYHYAAARTRQNQAIRLPEGPNLTAEQLKLIESQFKSGDFVMAKKDTDMMENPPIWRIDGKSLLQKFQAFEKDGKMLYRNISTYSGWTSQAKALYLPVKVNFVFQSRYDTVVELVGFKGLHGNTEGGTTEDEPAQIIDKPVWLPRNKDFEISEELRAHMPSFEIYLQTLISQALDNNFLQEIYEENDAYFVDRVKVIDELTEQRKAKILEMARWDTKFQTSLDTWPCVNTMVTKNTEKCQACGEQVVTMLSQFYGQPYDQKTLRSKEPSIWDLDHKNFETCDSCSMLSQLYNKVAHQKYEYYSQCKSTVTNVRVSQPNKSTTNVLRDLLANDEWITGLFRSMCTTWIKVDNMHQDRSSSGGQEPSKSPSGGQEPSKSPSGGQEPSKSPSGGQEPSKSPPTDPALSAPSASGGGGNAPGNNVRSSNDDDDPDDPAAMETPTPTANAVNVKEEGAAVKSPNT